MSEESRGKVKPDRAESRPLGPRQRPPRRRPKRDHATDDRDAFKGRIPSMEEKVFDVTQSKWPDHYPIAMSELVTELGRSIPSGGFLTKALDPQVLSLLILTAPPNPPDVTVVVAMEKWKNQVRTHEKECEHGKRATETAFTKLLGQCSPMVKDRRETYPIFQTIKASLDVIELAKLIQVALYNVLASGETTMTYVTPKKT
mmetsp:Transcript_22819/g.34570  ORF Transcript_22819/g.34570 Transcript_22819/m.34570 type:complete len:201 (-) Transcript_22819:674-1276(-)